MGGRSIATESHAGLHRLGSIIREPKLSQGVVFLEVKGLRWQEIQHSEHDRNPFQLPLGSRSDQAILWAVFRDSLFRMVEQHAQPCEVGGGFTALVSVSEVGRSRCSSLHTHDLRHHATSCEVAVGVQPKLVGLHLGSSPIYGTLPSCCNARGE